MKSIGLVNPFGTWCLVVVSVPLPVHGHALQGVEEVDVVVVVVALQPGAVAGLAARPHRAEGRGAGAVHDVIT